MKSICFAEPRVRTVLLIHTRELPTVTSCPLPRLKGRVPCSIAAEGKRRERAVPIYLLLKTPASPGAIYQPGVHFLILNSNYMGLLCSFVLSKCFCLCLPPLTNEPSDTRLYLLTVTSPTRAASPPSTTKACTTTRISGTCKSFSLYQDGHVSPGKHIQSYRP